MTSQRSTSIIRPSSDTITVRKRSRLMALGSVIARRLIIPSRASCILILRSKERAWALLDIVGTEDRRRRWEVQKAEALVHSHWSFVICHWSFDIEVEARLVS